MTTSKIRESTGGGMRDGRGRLFIRVTDRANHRTAELAPWATALEEVQARGELVQRWVNRLRRADMDDLVQNFIEQGAALRPTRRRSRRSPRASTASWGARASGTRSPWRRRRQEDTFGDLASRWTSGDLHRLHPDHIVKKASVKDDEERLEKHILPHVKDVPVRAFTRAHGDLVMSKLAPTLKPATRRQVAQLVNRVLRIAMFLGMIDRSPLPPGWLPRVPSADTLSKEGLLPSEEAKLLAGRNEKGEVTVPLPFRVAYAFLHREGMRKSEARALDWSDIRRGEVALDENKTDRPRSWLLQPATRRMLEVWHVMQGKPKSGLVFGAIPGPSWERLADLYREHCQAAGVDRERLFTRKANKLRLRAHDMRAFFITAGMFAGYDAMWITDRTGHTSLSMLRRYARDVRRWRELGDAPVDADVAIPEIAAAIRASAARVHGSKHGSKP